jgi:hypothetical protein
MKAKEDPEILSVMLFGSIARGEKTQHSDVDVCLVLYPKKHSKLSLSEKKLAYSKHENVDIHVYQQLPIYIRQRILKEGKVLFCRNEDMLYEIAFTTIREFNDFEPFYREYLKQVHHG